MRRQGGLRNSRSNKHRIPLKARFKRGALDSRDGLGAQHPEGIVGSIERILRIPLFGKVKRVVNKA